MGGGSRRPCQLATPPSLSSLPPLQEGGWPWRRQPSEGVGRGSGGSSISRRRRRGEPDKSGCCLRFLTKCHSGAPGIWEPGGQAQLPIWGLGTARATPGPPWLRREDQGDVPCLLPPFPPGISVCHLRGSLLSYTPPPPAPILQGRSPFCFNYF